MNREDFEASAVDAAEILIEREGVDGAMQTLNTRRCNGSGRAFEALAYLKRFHGDQV